MTSALEIARARLASISAVTALCPADQIYPIIAPQGAQFPHIVVELIYESDPAMLLGAAEFYLARVSVRCVARLTPGQKSAAALANSMGEAVKLALKDNAAGDVIAGSVPDFWKEGTDITLPNDDRTAVLRVLDYYISWRNP